MTDDQLPHEIRITYIYDGVCREVDDKIEESVEPLGYEWYASGYDLVKNERDVCFRQPIMNETDEECFNRIVGEIEEIVENDG